MSRTTTLLMIPLLACAVSENKADKDSGDDVTSDDTSSALHDTGDTGDEPQDTGPHGNDDTGVDTGVAPGPDTGEPPVEVFIPNWPDGTDPFADAIVNFSPGPDAGYGADELPDVVLGSPNGGGGGAGSLDVLSLGELGSITLELTDLEVIDGPGPDLLVFENPFPGWYETGVVEASLDGIDWYAWPCEAEDADGGFPGCAGTEVVYATEAFLVDPTDPIAAGGDAFDLADIGLPAARFVRITDSGYNAMGYGGTTGGFDLDAVAAANWAEITAD